MDLLSLIGQVTKRKGDLFSQAETLAKKAKTQDTLEKRMVSQSDALVKALRDRAIRWDEFHRSLSEGTLISALAAVYLGASGNNPGAIMERSWPTLIGDILPPLTSFLNETETYLNDGTLLLGDETQDFADVGLDEEALSEDEEGYIWDKNQIPYPVGTDLFGPPRPALKKRPTWGGILSRTSRYLASPTYSFHALGSHLSKVEQGYSLMRRVATHDDRTCPDCRKFDEKGWQPIGTLPMPGRQCRCYDRCRCRIEYS